MHGHSNLPPFGIIEKGSFRQNKENRVFAITTSWIMVKVNLWYTQVSWYGNEIGHSQSRIDNQTNKQAGEAINANRSSNKLTKAC